MIPAQGSKMDSGAQSGDDDTSSTVATRLKKQCYVQKYSGHGTLAESVLIKGSSYFLEVRGGRAAIKESIEEPDRILKPYEKSGNPITPYSFESIEEAQEYIERASGETFDTLYESIQTFVREFNETDEHNVALISADILFSYFQDRIGMTHYLFLVGDNGSGKNVVLTTVQYLGYRPILLSSPTPSNLYNVLGTIERGQVTILIDEANSIDKSQFMMDVCKTGYKSGGMVPRIDANFAGRPQYFYYTFGLKIIAAERLPDNFRARGLLDRGFPIRCYPGIPKLTIDKVIEPAGDSKYEGILRRILDLRKLLLAYRLVHFHDPIPDVKLNLSGREAELCSPLIRLFNNAKVVTKIIAALDIFLAQKRNAKLNSLEARVHDTVSDLLRRNKTTSLESSIIFLSLKEVLHGENITGKPYTFRSSEFGDISQKMIVKILTDKFGAEKHSNGEKRLITFDTSKLERIGKAYSPDTGKIRFVEPDTSYAFDMFDEGAQTKPIASAEPECNDNTDVGNVSNVSEVSEAGLISGELQDGAK